MTDASLIGKFRSRLNKGDSWLTRDISTLFTAEALKPEALEELETRLLLADAGVEATQWLIERLQTDINLGRIKNE
ncbi:MAG TPA: signal recognition particle receptor subunit alpha, partial [Solimonas sp.]|nr:signal recognition particle receptor subunit alpha [Solimonas sp.]